MVSTIRIDEVSDPLAVTPQSRNVQTGTGLTGGGDLSSDRTIALNAASIVSLGLADSSVQDSDITALLADATFTGPVKFPDGTAALPSITNTGDTDNGIYFPAADVIGFATAGTFAAMFDASQRFVVGNTAAFATELNGTNVTPQMQVQGTGANASMLMARFSADATPGRIYFAKSRNAAVGAHTIVQTDDQLGSFAFGGSDGSAIANGAFVAAYVDASPGANSMPTRIVVLTSAPGSEAPTEATRFDSSQRMITGGVAAQAVGANTPRVQLHGTGDSTANSAVSRWSADASGPIVALAKSRNATPGSHTVVQSGDVVASIIAYGSDGTGFIPAASIRVVVDGTPGTNDMPGKLSFSTTADGAASSTERVTIDQAGMFTASYGITTAAGTATIPPWKMTSGTNMTSVTAGAWEYDGKALYFAPAASSRGVVAVKQIATVQGSKVSLVNNSTGPQSIFASANDTLTVQASTSYRFRARITLNTGTTSHTTGFSLGGTATFTNIHYTSMATSSAADTLATPQMRRVAVATAAVLTAASTAATTDIWIEGVMRINGAGTIIPRIEFSAGPTGTCEVELNSFFELEPIGSDTVAAVGNWA